MPVTTFTLPNGQIIRLLYVVMNGGDVSRYYNGIRRGWIKEQSGVAVNYHRILPELIEATVTNMAGLEFDTIALVPSSRSDAVPFMRAVAERWPQARNITDNFRKGATKAADGGDLEVLKSSISYDADGKEHAIRSLLIVDESVASGKTSAAMIEHLKAAGMGEDVDVSLSACCWMQAL
jgi:hypothetical protein